MIQGIADFTLRRRAFIAGIVGVPLSTPRELIWAHHAGCGDDAICKNSLEDRQTLAATAVALGLDRISGCGSLSPTIVVAFSTDLGARIKIDGTPTASKCLASRCLGHHQRVAARDLRPLIDNRRELQRYVLSVEYVTSGAVIEYQHTGFSGSSDFRWV